MIAVLSCIHGNLEAFEAVLADIEKHPVEKIICLGDLVGYGPNPVECIALTQARCDVVLGGNFDSAVLGERESYPPSLQMLLSAAEQKIGHGEQREFLSSLPETHDEDGHFFVHGTPRNERMEYIFPEDIYNQRKIEANFSLTQSHWFCGHTHVPGVIRCWDCLDAKTWQPLPNPVNDWDENPPQWFSPEEIDFEWELDHRKSIVNVGSVGQPRNGDPLGCYVRVDDQRMIYRIVDDDIETTIEKIYDAPEFATCRFMGDRLRDGR